MKKFSFLFSFLFLAFITIQAQTITGVVPDSAAQCQQLDVTVTGQNTNFYQGTSFVHLAKGSHTVFPSSNTVVSPTEIVGHFFFNPDDPVGKYNVYATDIHGQLVLDDGFTLNAVDSLPVLLSNAPDTVAAGETVWFDITGEFTHFDAPDVENSVLFSNNGSFAETLSLTVTDAEHLRAEVQFLIYSQSGNYNLYFGNKLDGQLVLNNAFYLIPSPNPPQIVSVEPDSANQGDHLTLTVTGRNTTFLQGSSLLMLVNGNSFIYPQNHSAVNDTTMTGVFNFTWDIDTGFYDVRIEDNQMGVLTLPNGFTLYPGTEPHVTSITPAVGYEGKRLTVMVKASNTHFDAAGNTASVTLINNNEELYGHNVIALDSVTLQADFIFSYGNNTGIHDLRVETANEGTLEFPNSFNLVERTPDASIVSVVPDSSFQGLTMDVTVTGNDIIFLQGTSNLILTNGMASLYRKSITVENDTTVTGTFQFFKTDSVGQYNVIVEGGYAWPTLTLENGFTLLLYNFIGEHSAALLTVYPNPTNGILFVKRNLGFTGKVQLKVYDLQGRLILTEKMGKGTDAQRLDLTALPKGTYLLTILQGQTKQTRKFVVR